MNNEVKSSKDKILGIYSFYVTDVDLKTKKESKKRIYCYIKENSKGSREYKFTDDEKLALEIGAKYANDNGYNNRYRSLEALKKDPNFRVGALTANNINEMISNAPNIKKEDFPDVYDSYVKFIDKFNKKKEAKVKKEQNNKEKKKDKPKVIKKWAARVAIFMLTLGIGVGAGLYLNRDKTPTSKRSVEATIDDKDDKNDKTDDTKDKTKESTSEAVAKEDNNKSSGTVASANNSTSSSTTSSSNYSGETHSINRTKTPGTVNDSYLGYQDANAKLPDNENNNGNNNENQEAEEDKYGNVMTGEEEVTDNNTNDNEYSEEIDVSADDEEISEGDVIWEVNPDAVEDGSLTYVKEETSVDDNASKDETNDNSNETTNADPLPDPNKTATAGDGDYNTTEEELNQSQNTDTDVEEVPVEQETNKEQSTEIQNTQNEGAQNASQTTTQESTPTQATSQVATSQNTTQATTQAATSQSATQATTQAATSQSATQATTQTSTTPTNQDIAQTVVDAMAAGTDVTYDASTNTLTTNETTTDQAETSTSLTK